jgi:hypothetical protein
MQEAHVSREKQQQQQQQQQACQYQPASWRVKVTQGRQLLPNKRHLQPGRHSSSSSSSSNLLVSASPVASCPAACNWRRQLQHKRRHLQEHRSINSCSEQCSLCNLG